MCTRHTQNILDNKRPIHQDSCNRKSNQQNLGTIKSSNLCTEIMEYTDKDQVAVCNLASISLKSFVRDAAEGEGEGKIFDHAKLYEVAKVVTYNLNRVIDINYYPIPQAGACAYTHCRSGHYSTSTAISLALCTLGQLAGLCFRRFFASGWAITTAALAAEHEAAKLTARPRLRRPLCDASAALGHTIEFSNLNNRPIGIGIQGLADTFMELRLPYESEGAKALNREIFETIYFSALSQSKDLAKIDGPYKTYAGSPVSKGVLQPYMWGVTPTDRWDWAGLRQEIAEHGVRNSLLLSPMPTASTAQILGNNESFEPYTSNMYNRRVLSGEFTVVNKYLLNDLVKLGLWSAA